MFQTPAEDFIEVSSRTHRPGESRFGWYPFEVFCLLWFQRPTRTCLSTPKHLKGSRIFILFLVVLHNKTENETEVVVKCLTNKAID